MWRSRTRTFCPNCNERYTPRDRACGRCGRIRDQKTLAEMMAEANAWQRYLVWVWPTVGMGVLCFVVLSLVKHQQVPKSQPLVVVPPLSAKERARAAKQKASDAKFWAAKERREAREVDNYSTTLQVPPSGGSPEVAPPDAGNTTTHSEDVPSRAVLGAGVDLNSSPRSSGSGGGGTPSSQSQGTGGVSL